MEPIARRVLTHPAPDGYPASAVVHNLGKSLMRGMLLICGQQRLRRLLPGSSGANNGRTYDD
jgi:hypothetical protein